MIAGMDRYYQIVKCFRDEDLRADRQPEFTQIDMELSFITEEEIITIVEGMITALFKAVGQTELHPPFQSMTYDEAMRRYGTDRPDTRFGLELVDLTDTLRDCGFKVFRTAIENGGAVKAINAKGCKDSRARTWTTSPNMQAVTAPAAWHGSRVKDDEWQSPITKFFTEEELQRHGRDT
jgi:aspartyl-tRNA synthetase